MPIKILVFLITLFSVHSLFAQNKEFDKMEMLYDQGHYNIVLRKSNKLLNNPEYDFSFVPSYYKSLALFQLIQDRNKFQKSTSFMQEAETLFLKVKSSNEGMKFIQHHLREVSELKRDLTAWAEIQKIEGNTEQFTTVVGVITRIFDKIPDLDIESTITLKNDLASKALDNKSLSKVRQDLLEAAKSQLGKPYVYAGVDPKGFDCSGFASYVYQTALKKELPRKSSDQFEKSVKIKEKSAQPGDLIFFDSGNGVNHVGIVISQPNEPLMMIHASSSKGIIITEIEKSDYWKKRVTGFGSYL